MSELIDPSASSSSTSPGSDDDFSELLENLPAPPPPAKPRPLRQGLPADYRMRHDSHYVEELATRLKDAPAERADAAPPVSMPAALRDLCQEFEGLASCFNLLETTARPLREP